MCLAIANMSEVLPFSVFDNASIRNPDGMGMLYALNGKLHSYKALADYKDFYREYVDIRRTTPHPIVIHFRMATHGFINLANCHPFMVHKQLGFVHNGVFSGLKKHKKVSDTGVFNNNVLKKLPEDFLSNEGVRNLIEEYCEGYYSKLVFLDHLGNLTIMNASAGLYEGEDWFSNTSHHEIKVYTSYNLMGKDGKPLTYNKGYNSYYDDDTAYDRWLKDKSELSDEEAEQQDETIAETRLREWREYEDYLEQLGWERGWMECPPDEEDDLYKTYLEWLELQMEYDDGPVSLRSKGGIEIEEEVSEGEITHLSEKERMLALGWEQQDDDTYGIADRSKLKNWSEC